MAENKTMAASSSFVTQDKSQVKGNSVFKKSKVEKTVAGGHQISQSYSYKIEEPVMSWKSRVSRTNIDSTNNYITSLKKSIEQRKSVNNTSGSTVKHSFSEVVSDP